MNDYNELIKALRCKGLHYEDCEAQGCKYIKDGWCDYYSLNIDAADAIEELSEPRWIPVTERLPDVFKHVLVNIPGMAPHPTVQEAFREKTGSWYSNGFRYEADEITHWMPSPSTEGLNET